MSGAWDCHVHLFALPGVHRVGPDARYRPKATPLAHLQEHLARIGARHCVLVQPSVYGHDNSHLLNAMSRLGSIARGVISADPEDMDDSTLAGLHAAGVRGVRINPGGRVAAFEPVRGPFLELAARLKGTGWHIEIHARPALAVRFVDAIVPGDLRLVFDHAFGLDPRVPDFPTAAAVARQIAAAPHVWVKLSGADRVCPTPEASDRLDRAVRACTDTMQGRIVWGSDWPHTPLHNAHPETSFRRVDAAAEAARFVSWNAPAAREIFVENPQRLFA